MSEPVEKCSNCGILIAESKHALHEVYCLRNNVKCQRCGQFYDKNDLEGHDEEFHTKVQCPHCKQDFDNLNNHKCSKRPVACKFCKLDQPNDLIFQHENVCGSRTGNCQICNKPIILRDLEKHENTCVGVIEQKKPIQTQYQVRPSSSEKADRPIERGQFDRQFEQPRVQPQPYEYNARQNPAKIEPQKIQQQPVVPVANTKIDKTKQPIFENKPSDIQIRQGPQQPVNSYKPSNQQPVQQPVQPVQPVQVPQLPIQIPSYLKPENRALSNNNPVSYNQPTNYANNRQQNQFAQFNQQQPPQQKPTIQKVENPQERPNGSSHNDRIKPLVKQDSYTRQAQPLQTYGQQPRQVPQAKPISDEGTKILDTRQNRDNRDYNKDYNRDNREKNSNFDNKYDKEKYRNQVDQKSNNGEFRQPNISRQLPSQNEQKLTRPDTAVNRQLAQQLQMAEEFGVTPEELEQQLEMEKQFLEESKRQQDEKKRKAYNDPQAERQFAQRRDQEQRQQKRDIDYHQYYGGDEDEDLQKAILQSQNIK